MFLQHTLHRAIYMCKWCRYSDLITERFMFHMETAHNHRESPDVFWQPCKRFAKLLECNMQGCMFFTHEDKQLDAHQIEHARNLGPTDVVRVSVSDLSDAMQRALIRGQRRNMEEPSLFNKRMERSRGLVSPPLSITVDMSKPVQAVRPERSTPSDDEGPRRRPRKSKREDRPTPPTLRMVEEDSPVSGRERARNGRSNGQDFRAHYHMSYMMKILDLVQTLQPPPRMGRPIYLPLERAVRLRQAVRYVTEFTSYRRTVFMYSHELPRPMTGAVVLREEDDVEGSPIVTGIAITYHSGSVEARGQMQPLAYNWRHKGVMYDVYATPWCVVRKVQLQDIPGPSLYVVVDPQSYSNYDVEFIHMQ